MNYEMYSKSKRDNFFYVESAKVNGITQKTDLSVFDGLNGILAFVLETIQPIHVGSGRVVPYKDELYQEFYNHEGIPVIPGSSIKGMVYQQMLVWFNCEMDTKKKKKKKNKRKTEEIEREDDKIIVNLKSYEIENMLGSQKHAGRLFFEDAVAENRASFEPIDIESRHKPGNILVKEFEGVKFYVKDNIENRKGERLLVVGKSKRVRFKFNITFRNMSKAELGALFIALGLWKKYRRGIKIGGGKGYGLGLCKVEFDPNNSFYCEGAEDLIRRNFKAFDNTLVDRCIEVFLSKVDKDARIKGEENEKTLAKQYVISTD